MRKPVCTMLAATVLAAGFSFAEATQKRKSSSGKSKKVDLLTHKIKIPPRTVELAEPELRKMATKKVVPEYPAMGCSTRVEGDVVVAILVDENGQVIDAGARSGPALLGEASIRAAKRWEFQPFMKDGQPVKFTGTLTFRFNLGS